MRWCYKCNVSVNTTSSRCPLCYSQLEGNEDDAIFPYVPTVYIKHKLFIKVLLFISFLSSIICTIVNYLISGKIGWAWFVIAGIMSFWVTFIIGIKGRHHIIRMMFAEVIGILVGSVIWDYLTGFYAWSITYVLPFLSIAYMSVLLFLGIFLKNIFRDYVVYIYLNFLIGIIPLYFVIKNMVTVEWPSMICVIFSIFALLFFAIFNYRQMRNELERRLHI